MRRLLVRVFLLCTAGFLTFWLGYRADRSDFLSLALVYGALFLAYLAILHLAQKRLFSFRELWTASMVLRTLLLFSTPNLSDDVYRFLWDGRLAAQGIHPFAYTPAQVMESGRVLVGITPELFSKLNSPHYYTVYPPVCQGVFWVAAKVFPESIAGGVFVLKVFLLAADLLVVWVLWRLHPDGWAAAAYALHPLVLLEGVGNVHFEVAMLAFLLAGVWLCQLSWVRADGKLGVLSALFWALAVAVKLLPLLFLPIVWVWLKGRSRWQFTGYFILFCGLLFLPLWDWVVFQNLLSSLQLYFRQFAFNASVYYVLKGLLVALDLKEVLQARVLGPVLGGGVFVGVWIIAFYWKKTLSALSLADRMMLAATLYLLLATTVHPWYVLVPFALGLASARQPAWRYPVVWTAAVMLSYSHYADGSFEEKYGWIALEYAALGAAMVWDWTHCTPVRNKGDVDGVAGLRPPA
ncbi:MAG: polyprenol phosphomannose-dependent alpha 1,6 mannosyltransferase MptB [Saprospiraceae bacterium]|nr:polyprenol phosphomannose-dependent alpha 1,6 mannosyltransferase MptB [Saprospiraceae bacterium]MDW8230812.1 polyprenol phosphomannose-dependent alpha 1,6 mannosyltransferase MptB [Saprospiraceae bacterium]